MRRLITAFILAPVLSFSQETGIASCINTNASFFRDTAMRKQLAANIGGLKDGKFYMISQIHNSKIDIPLEKELLFALHPKGVQYDISEYPHSAFFLINEYLKSGDTSILKLISINAPFTFIREVYSFNQKQPAGKQIKFFGIDYELYNPDRGRPYKNALLYIYTNRRTSLINTVFESLFNQLVTTDEKDIPALTSLHIALQKALYKNEARLQELFSGYSGDIFLILSAPSEYKSIIKRDKWLFQRFKTVYDNVSKNAEDPKFIASFGAAHVKASNNNNITHKLQTFDESPVKEKVVIIGTQYFNGGGGIKEAKDYKTAGVLDYMATATTLDSISLIFANRTENVALLQQNKFDCLNNKVEKITALNWLFLINKQVWVKYWKWE